MSRRTSRRASTAEPRTHLNDAFDVAVAFSEVNVTEFSSTFPVLDVGFEHGARTFPLSPDHTSHGELKQKLPGISI